jgi:tripartite-type tricarboxylate transporter receptor subunit TctC
VVDNRPGAAGVVASSTLIQSAADGYTLIIVANGHAVNQFLYPKLPYDTYKDFTPISELGSSPCVIVVNNDFPVKTLSELIAMARAKPGDLSYGTQGHGTSGHLAGELLKYMAKIDIVPIPYKGGAPALAAAMAGEIPISINVLTEAMGQIRNGTVRAIAVTSAQRSPVLPDVPTVAESGVPGYDSGVWWGLLGPAGMRADLTEKIYRDFRGALADPMVQERLTNLGGISIASSPKEFDAFVHAEAARWEPVIRAANIKAE